MLEAEVLSLSLRQGEVTAGDMSQVRACNAASDTPVNSIPRRLLHVQHFYHKFHNVSITDDRPEKQV